MTITTIAISLQSHLSLYCPHLTSHRYNHYPHHALLSHKYSYCYYINHHCHYHTHHLIHLITCKSKEPIPRLFTRALCLISHHSSIPHLTNHHHQFSSTHSQQLHPLLT